MLPNLKAKDLIYICSPAKAIDEQSIIFSKDHLESAGFTVELSEHVLGTDNYFSGTLEERLHDLQKGLDHTQAKAILCARGGYGCIQLIEKLDWTEFKKNPKWLIGFSDITVLHLVLSKMGIPSLHASMPLNFAKNTTLSLSTLKSAITGNSFEITAPVHSSNRLGNTKNRIVGGNLAIVHAMLSYSGSDFFKDKILFIEDVGEHLYQIDRMFYGLKYLGVLKNISGLIIGAFTSISDTDSPFGKTLEELILDHVKDSGVPVGFGFPCGHQDDNQAIIMGGLCEFSVTQNGSRLLQQQKEALS
jgi:muramoyltetrapeptide carboxypeptidase